MMHVPSSHSTCKDHLQQSFQIQFLTVIQNSVPLLSLLAQRVTSHKGRNNNKYMFQQMLGVFGTCLVSPGWLVVGVAVGKCDVQTLNILALKVHWLNVFQTGASDLHLR